MCTSGVGGGCSSTATGDNLDRMAGSRNLWLLTDGCAQERLDIVRSEPSKLLTPLHPGKICNILGI